MKNRIGGMTTGVVGGLLLLVAAGSAWARNFEISPISKESYEHLNPEARAEYDRAYYLADHILYDQALDSAERAVELQPSSVELRYFVIRLAGFLGELHLEADAVKYLDRAVKQCQAILDMDGIPPTLRDRVRADGDKLADRARNIYRRDELRKTWGAEVAKEYVRSAYRQDFEKEKQERLKSTLETLRNPETRRSLAAKAAARSLAEPSQEGETPAEGTTPSETPESSSESTPESTPPTSP